MEVKKMTEREIIKALECCKDNNCHECPIKGCTEDIFVEALDLIDRQKAEIERLKKELMKCKLEKEMLYQTMGRDKIRNNKRVCRELEK